MLQLGCMDGSSNETTIQKKFTQIRTKPFSDALDMTIPAWPKLHWKSVGWAEEIEQNVKFRDAQYFTHPTFD